MAEKQQKQQEQEQLNDGYHTSVSKSAGTA